MGKAKQKAKTSDTNLPPSSAKIRKTLKLLDEIEERGEGEKTIIFSQFTSMLDIIEPFLKAKGIKYVRCRSLSLVVLSEYTNRLVTRRWFHA